MSRLHQACIQEVGTQRKEGFKRYLEKKKKKETSKGEGKVRGRGLIGTNHYI